MFEINEHNKSDCIKLLNMIICEIPFIKSFSDDCLLERLLNLISIITNAFDNPNNQSLNNVFDSEEERETAIREWLLRHYTAKYAIDYLNFNDSEDRTRVTILIFNILFKLRHSLKDIEQYLKDCDSFVHFDQQLNDIMRFDKLLEIVENDCNRWKSEAGYYKVKYDETKKLVDKYQQNEIFNYNCNPRNQNLYKSRITPNKESNESNSDHKTSAKNEDKCNELIDGSQQSQDSVYSSAKNHINQVIHRFQSQREVATLNNMDVNYLCIECDKSYSTKFEYNLHVLRDHKNIDISQIVSNSINSNNVFKERMLSKDALKRCKNIKKGVFRCIFNNCGKAFHKSKDLKTHFVRHQSKFEILCVYNDYTNAVLNSLRGQPFKAIRLTNYKNKPKKINSNNNKSINYNIDLNLKVKNFEFTNGFATDSHINHSNDLEAVPVCQTEGVVNYNTIDSFNFEDQITDEDSKETKVGFFSHFDKTNHIFEA